jgi:RND family efflux transporter MFP subunit
MEFLIKLIKSKIKIVFVVALAVIAIFLVLPKILPKKESQFKISQTKRRDLDKTISASGKIKADKEVTLKFQTSGKLVWVGVKEGDSVKAGQAIASLDKEELKKKLNQELIDYMNERWNLEQDREDQKVPDNQLDRYGLSNAIKRALEKSQFDLNRSVLDVEIQNIAIKLATLITPISGIVTKIDNPVPGVNVTSTTSTITVSDPTTLYFSANIDEADVASVKINLPVKVTLDAYVDQELNGEIYDLSFTSTTTSGGGTAFPAKIKILNPPEIRIGMNGDIEVSVESKKDVLSVPIESLVEKDDQKFVFKIENGKAKKTQIKTGIETDDYLEIIEGLNDGDMVISSQVSKVKENQKI